MRSPWNKKQTGLQKNGVCVIISLIFNGGNVNKA